MVIANSWSDCMASFAGLNVYCSHIPRKTFSHGADYCYVVSYFTIGPWSHILTTKAQNAQLSQDLLCLSIYSNVSKYSVIRQWRPWSDGANAQSDQGLRCPYMRWLSIAIHCALCLLVYHWALTPTILFSKDEINYKWQVVISKYHRGLRFAVSWIYVSRIVINCNA